MPRNARLVVPNCPHHVIQRGHNRSVVFVDERDYRYYLATLLQWKSELGCRVYGYCLMTNHVHLIIDPGENSDNLGLLMKRLAGRQTRRVNMVELRTGSLWDGRYKSSPIETDTYLLACTRYVELNPVRARMVSDPLLYPWSTYRAKVTSLATAVLDLDPAYLALGVTADERCARYQAWIKAAIPTGEWENIRRAIQCGDVTGTARFRKDIATKLARRIEIKRRGRPRKSIDMGMSP